MKYIITENQSKFLLHDILDKLFEGYKTIYYEDKTLVYVGDKLMMIRQPTNAILSKDIIDEVQNVLFYDSMNDFKDSVRIWVLENFPVKSSYESFYGITFKDFKDNKV